MNVPISIVRVGLEAILRSVMLNQCVIPGFLRKRRLVKSVENEPSNRAGSRRGLRCYKKSRRHCKTRVNHLAQGALRNDTNT